MSLPQNVRIVTRTTLATALLAGTGHVASSSAQAAPQVRDTPKLPAPASSSSQAAPAKPFALPDSGYYPPVPLTAQELQERSSSKDPKLTGALVLDTIDFSTPVSANPKTPNFSIYRSRAVPMTLKPLLLVVRAPQDVSAEAMLQELIKLNIQARAVLPLTNENYAIVELTAPIKDLSGARAITDRIIANSQLFSYASPVFSSPFRHNTGWLFPRQEMVFRTKAPNDSSLLASLPDFVKPYQSDLGGVAGTFAASVLLRNGFDVLAASNALAADNRMIYAEPDYLQQLQLHVLPNDPQFNQQWFNWLPPEPGFSVSSRNAYNLATGAGIRVLVMDNGTQPDHPDLNWEAGRNFSDNSAAGSGNGAPGTTCERHGTPVSGLIAQRWNNSLLGAGVAPESTTWNAKIGVQNVINPCGESYAAFSWTWVARAIDWGRTNGCRVSNASFGGGGPSQAVDDAYTNAYNNGMLNFSSAGNDNVATIGYPSSSPSVLSVGATDFNGNKASFSNFGPGLAYVAPGVSTRTIDRTGTNGYNTADWTDFAGTSASSPVTAGVAAMIMSAYPWITPGGTEFRMSVGARDLGAAGYDQTFGRGLVRSYQSISLLTPNFDRDTSPTAIPANASNWINNASVSTTTASRLEQQASCESGGVGESNSVWYSFTASNTSGTLAINTFGSNYDTVLSFWTGTQPYDPNTDLNFASSATQIVCNDDAASTLQSDLSRNLPQGTTVLVKVSRYGTAPSATAYDLRLTANFIPGPPPNNSCTTATQILANTYNISNYDTTNAQIITSCAGERIPDCQTNTSKPVWWEYTAPADGLLFINTFGSNYDTVLSVQSGCGLRLAVNICVSPTVIACSDDVNGGRQSEVTSVPVRAGSTYKIRVGGWNGQTGRLAMNFAFVAQSFPAPVNDLCSNATIIPDTALSYVDTVSTEGATVGDPNSGCADPLASTSTFDTSRSVWYTYTPAVSGLINLRTVGNGANYDSVLSIYSDSTPFCPYNDGQDCQYPLLAAWNDDNPNAGSFAEILSHPVTAGNTYLIRHAAYGIANNGGVANLSLDFTPTGPAAPINDLVENATVIPSDMTSFLDAAYSIEAATTGQCADTVPSSCEPTGLSTSVWYVYTPQADGSLTLSTEGSATDTQMTLFNADIGDGTIDPETGDCLSLPSGIECNDDFGDTTSQIQNVPITANTRYLVRISTRPDATPTSITFSATFTPLTPPCLADVGQQGGIAGSDGLLDNNDFAAFITLFFENNPAADLGQQGGIEGADGQFDNNDFAAFISLFFAGCP